MDEGKCVNACGNLAKGQTRSWVGDIPRIEIDQAGNNLQVVLDTMMNFTRQSRFLLQCLVQLKVSCLNRTCHFRHLAAKQLELSRRRRQFCGLAYEMTSAIGHGNALQMGCP